MTYRKIAFFLFSSFFMISWTCYAYPIHPRSLRQLYNDADLIVVANVQNKEYLEGDNRLSAKAILHVLSCLKGDIQNTVAVYFFPTIVCPSPPRYKEGKTVLAFLRSREKGEGYTTCSLSYGAKTLSDEKLKVYLTRIKELKNIIPIKDEELRLQRTTNWLMKCIGEKITRADGLRDLNGQSLKWSDKKSNPDSAFWQYLTDDHKDQLIAILESAVSEKNKMLFEVTTIMSILSKKTKSKKLKSILENYWKFKWNDEENHEKKSHDHRHSRWLA